MIYGNILAQYQEMIFKMFLNGRLSEHEFEILAALSEGIDKDNNAQKLLSMLQPEDLADRDLVDCILAKQFKTACLILE